MNTFQPFHTIGLAKEIESPENPDGLEKRVALIPADVEQLVAAGATVYVETGAGLGVGYADAAYTAAGALLQSGDEIYQDKDLIIKFKGPALESIPLMRPGATLFCMAHFHSFPKRAAALQQHRINVIAMEEIREAPEARPDEVVLARMAADNCLEPLRARRMELHFIGWSTRMVGAIRHIGRRRPRALSLLNADITPQELINFGPRALYFYDSANFDDPHHILPFLLEHNALLYDLHVFESQHGGRATEYYNLTIPRKPFGQRRIQALHETGQAGARYGAHLLTKVSRKVAALREAHVVVLGYGNVALGAMDECLQQGTHTVRILTERHTRKNEIEPWLAEADLIINGADIPQEQHGKRFLITREHVDAVIQPGTVIIDLIGGSPTNRSPVENIIECTYMNDPYFIEQDVYFSALWGWPMMGLMRETTIKYSGQILDVLLNEERLIEGLGRLTPGVEQALVCGPFYG